MSSKIRVLDEQTINKIAAGEVIENPSSVVKELVENAIDAGANDISVEIKGGGRQMVRVSDNGCGMSRDDALLSLERHATSKIKTVDDIFSIQTMGFRGEAIPSIASISKFIIMTTPTGAEENIGTMVIVDGGKIYQCCQVARSPGTTIEVKALFFNVPVRKKFQKSPAYDSNEILKMLSAIALGHPHIKFELITDQNVTLSTKLPSEKMSFGKKLSKRIKEILEEDAEDVFFPIDCQIGEMKLQGMVGKPFFSRPNRTGQYLYINNRAITSPLISYAVKNGYGTMLGSDRHPSFVLHLTVPEGFVDVNVHPQKREVRFRQEYELKELIVKSVNSAICKYEPSNQHEASVVLHTSPPLPPSHQTEMEEKFNSFSAPAHKHAFIEIPKERIAYKSPEPIKKEKAPSEPILPIEQKKIAFVALATINNFIILDSTKLNIPKTGLCLVDQKAAHSRVIFEKMISSMQKSDRLEPIQNLLIPHTVQIAQGNSEQISKHIESLNKIGISIHQSGPSSLSIDALPVLFLNADVPNLILELIHCLDEFQDSQSIRNEQVKKIALTATRASIPKKTLLSVIEAQSLLDQLINCEIPSLCPQGKQIFLHLTEEELLKMFLKKDRGESEIKTP